LIPRQFAQARLFPSPSPSKIFVSISPPNFSPTPASPHHSMDKLLARARNAQIQAKRRLDRQLALEKKRKINEIRQEHIMYQKLVTKDRKTSRKEEIEDHRLGPLKPIRAVGQREISMYGAFDQMRIVPPAVPDEHKIKHWNITVKDRVVVLRGPDRHKIGVVKSVDKDNNTVVVQGLNMV
jgi:large subunit ribosomal protein L24